MVIHMKTTLNINDRVMRQLREEAARRRTTISALVEAALRRILAESSHGAERGLANPVLPTWRSGGALVDVSNRAQLYSAMDEP